MLSDVSSISFCRLSSSLNVSLIVAHPPRMHRIYIVRIVFMVQYFAL